LGRDQQYPPEGGPKALSTALTKLSEVEPIRYLTVLGAFFPGMIREAIRDSLAEQGLTDDDLRELIRKLESPARKQ
jgi:hypothetical protein